MGNKIYETLDTKLVVAARFSQEFSLRGGNKKIRDVYFANDALYNIIEE